MKINFIKIFNLSNMSLIGMALLILEGNAYAKVACVNTYWAKNTICGESGIIGAGRGGILWIDGNDCDSIGADRAQNVNPAIFDFLECKFGFKHPPGCSHARIVGNDLAAQCNIPGVGVRQRVLKNGATCSNVSLCGIGLGVPEKVQLKCGPCK